MKARGGNLVRLTKAQLKRVETARAKLHKKRLKNDDLEAKARKRLQVILDNGQRMTDSYNSMVYKAAELRTQLTAWGE